jgi:hypothetical protein
VSREAPIQLLVLLENALGGGFEVGAIGSDQVGHGREGKLLGLDAQARGALAKALRLLLGQLDRATRG